VAPRLTAYLALHPVLPRRGRAAGRRGIQVDHVSIYRWVHRYIPLLIDAARSCRHAAGDRWFVDETYVKVARRWVYLYRAIDQHGRGIEVLASDKRDLTATRRFFTRALEHAPRPAEVTTDRHLPTCGCSMSCCPPPVM
jgi:transposase, IS6 family